MSEFAQVVKEGWSKVLSWVKRFFLIILVLAAVGYGGYVWVSGWTFSDGTRSGYLIKMSKKGVLFKTFEGQLNLGGVQTDPQAGVIGNIWEFSVGKRDVYEKLQNFEGKRVKLHYKQRYRTFFWQGDTEYFVYKAEAVE